MTVSPYRPASSGSEIHNFRTAIKQLHGHAVELPPKVTDAVAALDRIEARKPVEPASTSIHDAFVDELADSEIDQIAHARSTFHHRRDGWNQAVITAAKRGLTAIRKSADELHEQLRTQAEAIITRLNEIAKIGDVPLDTLIREGRHDEAKLLASKGIDVAALGKLYQLQRSVVWRGREFGYGTTDCSQYRNPAILGINLNDVVASLRNGAELWYPTPDEAQDAAAPIVRRAEAERKEREAGKPQNFTVVSRF